MSLSLLLSKSGQGCPPENSIAFIKHAFAHGFDGVYLKAQISANEIPYLFSDETTRRLCGDAGFFCYSDTSCIERLRVDGHAIAPLQGALECLQSNANRPFMVHVHVINPRALGIVAAAIQAFHRQHPRVHLRYLLICADAPTLQLAKRKYPEMSFALYMPAVPLSYAKDAADSLAEAVYLPEAFHSVPLIRDAQSKNLRVYIEGVPNVQHLDRLRDLFINGAAGTSEMLGSL